MNVCSACGQQIPEQVEVCPRHDVRVRKGEVCEHCAEEARNAVSDHSGGVDSPGTGGEVTAADASSGDASASNSADTVKHGDCKV